MQTSQLPDPKLDAQFYEGVLIKRLFAWALDFIIIFAICTGFVIITLGTGIFVLPLFALAANLGYRTWCLTKWSATLGMRMTGIEIRNAQGNRVETNEAFFHSGLIVVIFLTGLGIFANILAMLINNRGQGLHDMILGTTAINRPAD